MVNLPNFELRYCLVVVTNETVVHGMIYRIIETVRYYGIGMNVEKLRQ